MEHGRVLGAEHHGHCIHVEVRNGPVINRDLALSGVDLLDGAGHGGGALRESGARESQGGNKASREVVSTVHLSQTSVRIRACRCDHFTTMVPFIPAS